MHLVEQVGSGIGRIHDLMKAAELPEPIFQKEGIFAVTLFRSQTTKVGAIIADSEKSREKSRERIIELIRMDPTITMADLAFSIGISVKAIEKQISSLKKAKRLERDGPDKGGRWRIVD